MINQIIKYGVLIVIVLIFALCIYDALSGDIVVLESPEKIENNLYVPDQPFTINTQDTAKEVIGYFGKTWLQPYLSIRRMTSLDEYETAPVVNINRINLRIFALVRKEWHDIKDGR